MERGIIGRAGEGATGAGVSGLKWVKCEFVD